MNRMGVCVIVAALVGCGSSGNAADGVGSEVATSVVSGAVNNNAGSAVGLNTPRKTRLEEMLHHLNPISTAHAASWTCMGGTLNPSFSGPSGNPYTFTPVSCTVNWGSKTASSDWSSTFTLVYGSSCDSKHELFDNQAAECSVTRTTAAGGNTRTITGPDGNAYSVTHDTNGAGTGWDSTVLPAPGNGGLVLAKGAAGSDSASLVINGSHLTGTLTPAGGAGIPYWDHTVSTGTTPLTVAGSGIERVVTGSVTVQHNILKFTTTTTFNSARFGDPLCCYPTSGSVTTSFSGGPNGGKTESLSFTSSCGEGTLTTASGATESLVLKHCL